MTPHPNDDDKQHAWRDRRIVRWKVGTFAVLAAVFLVVQYLVVSRGADKVWDMLSILVLAYSVLMLADALYELFDEKPPDWSNSVTGFLLPVEPRGVPNLFAMLGLLVLMVLVIQIRGCADDKQPQEAPQSENAPQG